MAYEQPDDGPAVPLLREERGRRRAAYGDGRGQLARRRLSEVSVGREHVPGALGTPDDEAAGNGRTDLVQAECEPGDDAEVASPTPERPEEVSVLSAARRPDEAVRGDEPGARRLPTSSTSASRRPSAASSA